MVNELTHDGQEVSEGSLALIGRMESNTHVPESNWMLQKAVKYVNLRLSQKKSRKAFLPCTWQRSEKVNLTRGYEGEGWLQEGVAFAMIFYLWESQLIVALTHETPSIPSSSPSAAAARPPAVPDPLLAAPRGPAIVAEVPEGGNAVELDAGKGRVMSMVVLGYRLP